jgi:hypothetical protein
VDVVEQLWHAFDDLGELEGLVIDDGAGDLETIARLVEQRLREVGSPGAGP